VWLIDARRWAGTKMLEEAYALLSPAEQARANRLRRPLARIEFIAGRAFLRQMLVACLAAGGSTEDCARQARLLPIEIERWGKPRVSSSLCGGEMLPAFNVAHSQGLVLIALSQAGPVGVDLEYVDPSVDAIELAETSFAGDEAALVGRAATRAERLDLFYSLWTSKEAIAKADGRGLQLAFSSFSAAAAIVFERCPDCADRKREFRVKAPGDRESRAVTNFFVRRLPIWGISEGNSFRAALATTVPGLQIEMHRWPPGAPSLGLSA
jgi:4'-phosphopantetheinyl transferase